MPNFLSLVDKLACYYYQISYTDKVEKLILSLPFDWDPLGMYFSLNNNSLDYMVTATSFNIERCNKTAKYITNVDFISHVRFPEGPSYVAPFSYSGRVNEKWPVKWHIID